MVVVAQASQAVQSRKLGTSHARARAKAEAGRNRSKMAKIVPLFRARVVLADCSRIKVVDSPGTAIFAASQVGSQFFAH